MRIPVTGSAVRLVRFLVAAVADHEHLADPPAIGGLHGQRQAVHLHLVAGLGHPTDPVVHETADRVVLVLVLERELDIEQFAEIVRILERVGARAYTRDAAVRYRDQALAELDAAGVVQPAARARLEEIIVGVISA